MWYLGTTEATTAHTNTLDAEAIAPGFSISIVDQVIARTRCPRDTDFDQIDNQQPSAALNSCENSSAGSAAGPANRCRATTTAINYLDSRKWGSSSTVTTISQKTTTHFCICFRFSFFSLSIKVPLQRRTCTLSSKYSIARLLRANDSNNERMTPTPKDRLRRSRSAMPAKT